MGCLSVGSEGCVLVAVGGVDEKKIKYGHELLIEEKQCLYTPQLQLPLVCLGGGARCYVGVMFLCP